MNIATLLSVHGNTEIVLDTLASIHRWVGPDVLVMVDGSRWGSWGKDVALPAPKLQGLRHGIPSGSYRNVMLGLMHLYRMYPHVDWYCHCEYDVLFGSDEFKYDLENKKAWCIGNNLRAGKIKLRLLDSIARMNMVESRYLLGCCMFHKREFMERLHKMDFFERFLSYTNSFSYGEFPEYREQGGYDVIEHVLPTMALNLGGRVAEFASWDRKAKQWGGDSLHYPVRWMPDLEDDEIYHKAFILHPIKDVNHPLRTFYRNKR